MNCAPTRDLGMSVVTDLRGAVLLY